MVDVWYITMMRNITIPDVTPSTVGVDLFGFLQADYGTPARDAIIKHTIAKFETHGFSKETALEWLQYHLGKFILEREAAASFAAALGPVHHSVETTHVLYAGARTYSDTNNRWQLRR